MVSVQAIQRERFARLLTMLGTLELLVTLLVALATLVPHQSWTGNVLTSLIGSYGIQVLLCIAVLFWCIDAVIPSAYPERLVLRNEAGIRAALEVWTCRIWRALAVG